MPHERKLNDDFIVVRDLSVKYRYGRGYALKDVSFNVKEGEKIGVIGPIGSGKTTLCLALRGLIPHLIRAGISGEILIAGVNPLKTKPSETASLIGLVLDDPEVQLTQLSVKEEIAFGLQNLGISREEIEKRIDEVLKLTGLEGLEERDPTELSGGQQQRLAIASVLAMKPKVLILDEPTSNLDPQGKQEVFETISEISKRERLTIIITEQEVEWIAEYTDRVLLLHQGKKVAYGTPEEVFNQVEKLKEVKVKIPQVTELFYLLKKDQIRVDGLPITLKSAYQDLKRILRFE
mgnify:CR=1 FL=1